MSAASTTTPNELGCANEVWNTITEFFSLINHSAKAIGEIITRGVETSCSFFFNKIFLPMACTGANVLGYFFDKILFGSPSLRKYFHDGLFPSEIPDRWRQWVKNNSGWDIYESMGIMPSNLLGIFGAGFGFLNILNHLYTSFYFNVRHFWHLMGDYGVFGQQEVRVEDKDKRNNFMRYLFGALSAPTWIPVITLTNTLDVLFTIIKNTALSYGRLLRSTFNIILGHYGVFHERIPFHDARSWPAILFYGALAAPFVIPTAIFTNIADCMFRFLGDFFLSLGRNTRVTFNLLGQLGLFGKKREFTDDRHISKKIIYGILSAPLVGAISVISNAIYATCAIIKNLWTSYGHNVHCTYNILLGNKGRFGDRSEFKDTRGWPAIIIFGALSSPFVLATSVFTNILDLACTFSVDFFYSFIHNIRVSFNLLGKDGIFKERRPYGDTRSKSKRIIYGILSAPFVLVAATVTNLVDIALSSVSHFFISYGYNVYRSFNFILGPYGSFGSRRHTDTDTRGKFAKVLYGILSAPFVFATSALVNVIDIAYTTLRHISISFYQNMRMTFNGILGDHGIFHPRREYNNGKHKDNRNLYAKIAWGIVSAPLVAAASIITNVLDVIGTFSKHLLLSYGRNVRATFNILFGHHGIFGERRGYQDDRHVAIRIGFGILTSPFVLATSLTLNAIDAIGSYFKNWRHTIKKPAIMTMGFTIGTALALPALLLRKTVKGIYNVAIRPFVDAKQGKNFNGARFVKSILNVATLGLAAIPKKIFEAATGYTSRFGFPPKIITPHDVYKATQEKFRQTIELAKSGKLPGVEDRVGLFRPVMRVFYHMRHKAEDILKAMHNSYLDYAKQVEKDKYPRNAEEYSMLGFFRSERYVNVKHHLVEGLRQDEKDLVQNIETQLRMT